MKTILRFFEPNKHYSCEQYEGENLIAPQIDAVITLECDYENVYRVDDVNYVYDDDSVMIDVELRNIEEGYWDKFTDEDELDCNGECERCELSNTVIPNKETEEENDDNVDNLLNAVANLLDEFGISINIAKE